MEVVSIQRYRVDTTPSSSMGSARKTSNLMGQKETLRGYLNSEVLITMPVRIKSLITQVIQIT